jgi:hypothetical protein
MGGFFNFTYLNPPHGDFSPSFTAIYNPDSSCVGLDLGYVGPPQNDSGFGVSYAWHPFLALAYSPTNEPECNRC